ncbi:MucR family transcriptional regulator [Microvirga guangxiensis]|uniref:ROS/MUCR transcriptional regulator protein n=1 Tax=Microvirga guangxiensis TaxID=549386 RepID=A0A1G5KE97_9HYPH|nr:ROS/MUCR transcriptional regulator protein [Microvirga guangxiensis]
MADIVSSYVANNSVHRNELPNVMASVHAALKASLGLAQAEPEKPQPAVPIRKSVTPNYLMSLEDGRKYKSLKRHLRTLGLTPNEYRAGWDLPAE